MNRMERLQEVLRLEGLASAARDRAAEHRQALADDARAELDREGAAPTWRMADLGTITLPVSKEQPTVADPPLFLAWCKQRHPDQVEHVEQVRGGFQGALLAGAVLAGEHVVDGTTGEVVPGLGVRPGGLPGALTIRPSHEARVVYAAAGAQLLDQLFATVPAGGEPS